jgi:hypothetical protein
MKYILQKYLFQFLGRRINGASIGFAVYYNTQTTSYLVLLSTSRVLKILSVILYMSMDSFLHCDSNSKFPQWDRSMISWTDSRNWRLSLHLINAWGSMAGHFKDGLFEIIYYINNVTSSVLLSNWMNTERNEHCKFSSNAMIGICKLFKNPPSKILLCGNKIVPSTLNARWFSGSWIIYKTKQVLP